ncbi:UV DNA damage repair endonuclease UvsE [Paenibacillus abyssi]|uniref:UV damage endonuclease UvsE n=1 Tax=Paenibacillus abyssi TaxID=1340531 RepID=A0A917G5E2_9BACL|nr:UV DNA damage repair endonuclease UvsE [Paenibacillus abyssi]GGG24056.1 UV damage endonuclease UvsE [Paenibacillus abyssi]
MIVRFGFVAMSMLLENASPSRTMTYKNFAKLADRGAAVRKLERIAEENLNHTLRVLRHAVAHDIRVYRFSSRLIPLSTHDELHDWNPFEALKDAFAEVGRYVREQRMRVSFHPDHFCVLNSPRPEVLAKSIADLENHVRMLDAMGQDERSKCNIHVGGAYGDKKSSGERFIRQFAELDDRYKRRITLENDDKTFTAEETLAIAEASNVPMVLDIHHHAVNGGGVPDSRLTGEIWPRIVRTWEGERKRRLGQAASVKPSGYSDELPPKLHASSPRSERDPRSHADHVEPGPLLRYLYEIADSVPRIDVMLEAKQKDAALLQLMEQLRLLEKAGEPVTVIDGASVEINSR